MKRATQSSRSLRRIVLAACAGIITGAAGWPAWNAWAQNDAGTLENRVKAAFLYKFAGYVDWPAASFARPDTPVTIAVVGAEPLASELVQAVTGRTVNDRQIVVKRFKPGEPLTGVHVLFVGRPESPRVGQLAQAAHGRSVLIVTEAEGALAQGSVINFTMADRRVRFEVSLESAEKTGLKLSSRLLAVAEKVVTGAP